MKIVKLKNKDNEEVMLKTEIPKYLLAYLKDNLVMQSEAWVENSIPLTIKENKTNSKITLNNDGKLVIGSGVSLIEINYAINVDKKI